MTAGARRDGTAVGIEASPADLDATLPREQLHQRAGRNGDLDVRWQRELQHGDRRVWRS